MRITDWVSSTVCGGANSSLQLAHIDGGKNAARERLPGARFGRAMNSLEAPPTSAKHLRIFFTFPDKHQFHASRVEVRRKIIAYLRLSQ